MPTADHHIDTPPGDTRPGSHRGVPGEAHAHGPESHDADTPDLAVELRARGLRVTAQREKVLDAVRALRHATPEQLSDAVEGVDVATVYRTLELLEELGLVKHTHLGHGAPSYRPAEDDHIHLVCHVCGAVADAEPGIVDVLERELRAGRGFTLDRAHFTVFGRCAACTGRTDDAEQTNDAEQTKDPER